jgi:hypothetical protein
VKKSPFTLVQIVVAVCIILVVASLVIAAPALPAQVMLLGSGRVRWMQIESPILTPPASPLPAPTSGPLECSAALPCTDDAPTPQSTFQAFLPGLSEPEGAPALPPGPPPDLGTILNYVAAAVVVIGVTLKVYWFIADRRKGASK